MEVSMSSCEDIRDVMRAEQHRHRATPTPQAPGCDDLVPTQLMRGEADQDRTRVRLSVRRLRRLLHGEPTPF